MQPLDCSYVIFAITEFDPRDSLPEGEREREKYYTYPAPRLIQALPAGHLLQDIPWQINSPTDGPHEVLSHAKLL